jgi:hypothetical protein
MNCGFLLKLSVTSEAWVKQVMVRRSAAKPEELIDETGNHLPGRARYSPNGSATPMRGKSRTCRRLTFF